jgi:sigma-E factor negative regulatory protein RseC
MVERMIEERAKVVGYDKKYVWVETQPQSSCGQCSVKKGCGTQVLAKVLANKTASIRCKNSHKVEIGDDVTIAITESSLLKGSFLMYLLPLLIMIVSGGLSVYIARQWWPDWVDLFAIIASFSGLFLGMFLSRQLISHQMFANNNKHSLYEPVVMQQNNKN